MTMPDVVAEVPAEEAQRLKMTYEEFLAWADEDVHAEWVDGEVIVHMPPKDRHQNVVAFLITLLRLFADFFDLGQVRTAPFEMKLAPDGPSREPDILLVMQENLDRITEERVAGPADLVVEVISDDSVTRDRVRKFGEYQEFGVQEYWSIDPRLGHEQAEFWVLDDQGKYQPAPVSDAGVYHSSILLGFWLRPSWLWTERLPDPQLTFAEIAGFPAETVATLREIAARGPHTPTSED